MAAGLRSFVPGAQGAQGAGEGAAMPQVHAVLLEQLDLVPSKGGIEAAGLRFMQLQVSWTMLAVGAACIKAVCQLA